jgi:ribonuclease P protein component
LRHENVQRLKTRTQFQAVMAGSTVARTAHFALHCVPLNPSSVAPGPVDLPEAAFKQHGLKQQNAEPMPAKPLFEVRDVWMGAMVPKRWAKRAVTRNAIKRQIYNVSALAKPDLQTVFGFAAHVVRLRAGFDKLAYPSATSDALKAVVRQELNQLFAKAARGSK